jgi:formate hydrogenlyase transcriptional activator
MDQQTAEAPWGDESPRLDATFEAVLRLAIDSAQGGVLIVDPDGTIVLVNQQLERQFGYSREELVGQVVDRLLPKALQAAHVVHRHAFMLAPTERPMGAGRALFGRRRDGSEFPIEIGLNPIETDRGVFVVASVVDVTAGLELEAVNRVALEEQLDFERLVAELSAQFINLPADQIDEAIRTALGRIGEAFQLDRCTFFRVLPDGALAEPVGWVRPGFPPTQAPVAAADRFPWVLQTLRSGQMLSFSFADDIPNPIDRESFRSLGIRSSLAVPLSVSGRIVGAVGFNTLREERSWPPEEVHRLRVFATVFANVLARRESDETLNEAFEEVRRLRDRLQAENVYLRTEVRERAGTDGAIIGRSDAIRRVLAQIEQVAATNSTVLLLGETGTGKELFATQIHQLSARRARAMVRVNCAAIPATLMESELFGREKGAFTGALARQIGRFELADHSTIFLDEIGDLPLDIQIKLLRVLEERQIERLGSPKPIGVDTRIVAATHRNLVQRIADGAFREDLYYRLNVFPIEVPPLRERGEDIPLLVWRFVEEFSKAFGKPIDTIPSENLAALQHYGWPGNIRELRNVVERAMIATTGRRLLIPVPTTTTVQFRPSSEKLTDVETEHIRGVLESTGWRIRGSSGAAERLGLRPTTLETRLAKLGLRRPKSS